MELIMLSPHIIGVSFAVCFVIYAKYSKLKEEKELKK